MIISIFWVSNVKYISQVMKGASLQEILEKKSNSFKKSSNNRHKIISMAQTHQDLQLLLAAMGVSPNSHTSRLRRKEIYQDLQTKSTLYIGIARRCKLSTYLILIYRHYNKFDEWVLGCLAQLVDYCLSLNLSCSMQACKSRRVFFFFSINFIKKNRKLNWILNFRFNFLTLNQGFFFPFIFLFLFLCFEKRC